MDYDKRNGNVVFQEKEHKYWDLTNPEAKFISVTTLIESFGKPFNSEFWSMYKSLEKLIPKEDWKTVSKTFRDTMKIPEEIYSVYNFTKKDAIREQQNILDEWQRKNEESCTRGTKIHAELENSFYKMGANCNLQRFGIGGKFICDKGRTSLDLEDGIYPEYLISRISDDGLLRLAGQIDLLVKKGHNYTIMDWKGLPLDTEILTNRGWSTIGKVQEGDIIYDKNGEETKILHKSEIHTNPCYKITFDNGDSIVADCDHRWEISFKKSNCKGYNNKVMTTKELYNYLNNFTRNSYTIPKILNPKPLNCLTKNLLVDPYVLGAWLGDGSKDCGIITQAKGSKLWDEIKSRGFEISENDQHNPDREFTEMRTVYGLRTLLKKLNLLNNKHIPEEYYTASFDQRLDLLRGFMDTDGYYHPKRKRFVMSTGQEWQRDDLVKLLGTLGIKPTVFYVIKKVGDKKFDSWDVCFSTKGLNPFLIRNQGIEFPVKDKCSFRNIDKVEIVETVPTQCLEVDSPTHTFLCTEKCIVTHNTNKEIKKHSGFDSKTKSEIKMKYPLNTLPDCNYYHYNLQLSTYAWMIQKLDPEAIIDDLILVWFPHEGGEQQFHMKYLKREVVAMLSYYKHKLIQECNEQKYKEIEY